MYAVSRQYQFDPKAGAEIARKIQEDFVPLVRKTPGFLAYYWVDSGTGKGSSLGVFESKTGADQSVHLAADYVRDHLASILGSPAITEGEVRAHA